MTCSHTDTKQVPWYVVDGDDKRKALLNCISHLLSLISYNDWYMFKDTDVGIQHD